MAVSSAAEKRRERHQTREGEGGRERLGGARADFVANLGRRRAEIRDTLEELRADATSKRHVTELRRRFHALGAAAKLLRFSKLAEEIRGVEAKLEEAAHRGDLLDSDFGAVHDLVGRMTALAWGGDDAEPVRVFANEVKPFTHASEPQAAPLSVLVVGPPTLADSLTLPHGRVRDEDHVSFDVERASGVRVALDLARALAPDCIVVDGDLGDAKDLVGTLSADPLTEAIPVVVCLRITRPEEAGPFLALGVAKTLAKPVTPAELRRACVDVVATYVKCEVAREPIGELNVDQLGHRLAEELRRGLCDMADPKTRTATVKLGDGTEVLAALWGAVARIRDVVTIRSEGGVRFLHGGPEGGIPLAPWLDPEVPSGSPRRSGWGAAARHAEGTLGGTRVVVVDDDAAVCWFLAGVLKSAGATVYEARDGERALEIAKHHVPDLIISDVLMPRMDGFSLCRTLKRDLLLRDVPVVLLSWKEDLLQRVRELGAEADGYMRKEASATAIVQRARELVRTRQRVAQRVSTSGEIRGRLDGITTFSLLRLACELRPDCTVSVRDASFLYEVEIRCGRPVRATRTSLGGAFERGPSVLGALLGVGDGRFVVSSPRPTEHDALPVRPDLDGTLLDQITPVIAAARGAQRLLTGPNMLRVGRVEIDEDAVRAYWGATPESARAVVSALSNGTPPRSVVASGHASARLVEDVLADVAAPGAIVQVIDVEGEDRLPEATSHELALMGGAHAAAPLEALPLPAAEASPAVPVAVAMPHHGDLLRAALAPAQPFAGASAAAAAPEPAPAAPARAEPEAAAAGPAAEPSLLPPLVGMPMDPFAQPSASEVGLDHPWFDSDAAALSADESPQPPSGPRALTPPPSVLGSLSPPPVAAPALVQASKELTPTPSKLPVPPGLQPMLTLGSLHPPPVEDLAPAPVKKATKDAERADQASKPERTDKRESTPRPTDATPKYPLPSAYLPRTSEAPRKDRKALYWALFALVGVVFAVWARWSRDKTAAVETAMMSEVQRGDSSAGAPLATGDAPPAETDIEPAPRTEVRPNEDGATAPEVLPLRDSDKLKKSQGLLEIVAGKSDTIYIDGKPVGSGPTVSLPLKARKYEVRVKTRGDERTRFVEVIEGKLVRVRIAPPWQR